MRAISDAYCLTVASNYPIGAVAHCRSPKASYCTRVEIDISLGQTELLALLAEVAPLRIHLTPGDEDRRRVQVLFVPELVSGHHGPQQTVTDDALLLRLSVSLGVSRTRARPSNDPT